VETGEDRLALIGGGAMGGALLAGILEAGAYSRSRIVVAEPNEERRSRLGEDYSVKTVPDVASAIAGVATVLVAVKQGALEAVCAGISAGISSDLLLVSIVAGVPAAFFEHRLPENVTVVRAMPNTPALVGKGTTGLAPGTRATAQDMQKAESLLLSVGVVVRCAEEQLDAVTALSGSGPAYWFLVAESMIEGGVRLGLTREQSTILVESTMTGAAALLSRTDQSPSELRSQVTSPAGTTAAALHAMEKHRVRYAFLDALEQAAKRSAELGRQFV